MILKNSRKKELIFVLHGRFFYSLAFLKKWMNQKKMNPEKIERAKKNEFLSWNFDTCGLSHLRDHRYLKKIVKIAKYSIKSRVGLCVQMLTVISIRRKTVS